MAHEQPGVGRRAVEVPWGEEQSQTFRERRRALFLGFGGDVLRVPGRVVGTAVAVPVGADGQEIDGRTAVVTAPGRSGERVIITTGVSQMQVEVSGVRSNKKQQRLLR